jgi:ribosomal protein S18 acetylase RimI-like enzyme
VLTRAMEASLHQTFRIERLGPASPAERFHQLAKLHVESIHGGIMEALGPHFLASLYQQLSRRSEVLMYAARRDQQTIGFVAGTFNLMDSLTNIGVIGLVRLALTGAANLWRPRLLKKVFQTAGYFFRGIDRGDTARSMEDASDPERSELLVIAVAEDARGQGIGTSLVDALEKDFQNRGAGHEYFVSTNCDEIESNAFYRTAGFTLVGQKRHHDLMLNVYKKELE